MKRSLAHRLRPMIDRSPASKVLRRTTLAFFFSFVVWFNLAPFAVAIRHDLHLTASQMTTLALCNLALAVPARVVVGKLLAHIGPRRLYPALLVGASVPNTVFALAHSYTVLVVSRLVLGVVGAGFVVGIRMVSAWFADDNVGTAEGIYGGWGNFGSAAAALALPTVAAVVAGGHGAWRWGIGLSGLAGAVYGLVYLFAVDDAPSMVVTSKARAGGLRVSGRVGPWGLALMQLAVPGSLFLVAWRVHRAHVVSGAAFSAVLTGIAAFGLWQLWVVRTTHRGRTDPGDAVAFAPVAVLSLAYGVTFGAELTMASLLPTFFASTFALKITAAGVAGSAFAFTNLVTRPGGGLISDISGRRRSVIRIALLGSAASFALLTMLDRSWPLMLGVAAVALTSVFVQGANGAIFAMVPLVGRRSGGQIAGLAGSYGNAGGVLFSSILFFTGSDVRIVFAVMGAGALGVATLCRLLPSLAERQVPAEAPAHVATAAVLSPA